MKKVLFVCLGNICRSPLAEALFKKHVASKGLSNQFRSDSCGTAAYHIGAPPDQRSVANAQLNGLDYTHVARKLCAQDFEEFDYILAMDDNNLADIKNMAPKGEFQLYKMRDFDRLKKGADVPDPYFDGEKGFQEVFEILDRATLHLLEEISTSK